MTLVRASQPDIQPAPEPKRYRSQQELDMRARIEGWARERYPEARVVHELVVGRGEARADMALVSPNTFAAIEIKSAHDSTTRLVAQACMFRLVSPELWIATTERHAEDVDTIQYLVPTLGVLGFKMKSPGWGADIDGGPEVLREAQQFQPHPESMLRILWVAELAAEAQRHSLWQGASSKPPAHERLVKLMMKLSPVERLRSVCRQLRMRDAMWRADPPLSEAAA